MEFVELFAGIGLFRRGLEAAPGNWRCLLANDIDAHKCTIYRAQYGACDLVQEDIAFLGADRIPGHPDFLTGSFPCQDLSLAGNRLGLAGERSGQALHFFRLVRELQQQNRSPHTLVLENVVGLMTSHDGADVRVLLEAMNALGYAVDLLLLDAVHWLPHSRPRIFIVGRLVEGNPVVSCPEDHPARPPVVVRTLLANKDLQWAFLNLPSLPTERLLTLHACIDPDAQEWFTAATQARELGYIANGPSSQARLSAAQHASQQDGQTRYLTGYRRMRREITNLELRGDGVAGCLRTVSGGSSRQMLIRVTGQGVHLRLMTPREYALLMGVNPTQWQWADLPTYRHLTGFGDAVAVPVVTWLAQSLLAQGVGVVPAAMVEEPLETVFA
jgi:DNA (cytosine-5)-methyltransferase 1